MLLPSKIIEQVYTEVYNLKNYAPIIMQPHVLRNNRKKDSTYYSLAYPTLLESIPHMSQRKKTIIELRGIRKLMNTLLFITKKQNNGLYNVIKNISLQYFHSDNDKYGELSNSSMIPQHDQLMNLQLQRFANKEFPSYGQFFRGCILISTNPSN